MLSGESPLGLGMVMKHLGPLHYRSWRRASGPLKGA